MLVNRTHLPRQNSGPLPRSTHEQSPEVLEAGRWEVARLPVLKDVLARRVLAVWQVDVGPAVRRVSIGGPQRKEHFRVAVMSAATDRARMTGNDVMVTCTPDGEVHRESCSRNPETGESTIGDDVISPVDRVPELDALGIASGRIALSAVGGVYDGRY